MAQESKTEAIRRALLERRALPRAYGEPGVRRNLREYLEREVWPLNPPSEVGRALTREEEDEILGYGPAGV